MAFQFNLAPNEFVVLKETDVAHGGIMTAFTDDLILTNLHVICINKGLFGKVKNVFYYPLNQLKQYNGKVQAVLGKLSNGTETLDLYFVNSVETFYFTSSNKKTINKWINAIAETVGCKQSEDEVDPNSFVGTIKQVADDFRAVLGFKSKGSDGDNNRINKKCISCSAPLVGKKGEVVHCKYCDTDQTL